MEDIKAMQAIQWKVVLDLQAALARSAPAAGQENEARKCHELAQALESGMNVWRMLKDLRA